MLQSMRNLSKSWIFKSLMLLLVVSFGIWGIGDMFRGNPAQSTVAQVGSIKIPVQSLESRFQIEIPQARQIFGADLSVAQARQIGVLDRTLRMMMEEYAFDLEAGRLGINVSNETILKKLANEPHFRDKDGKFNPQLWHQALRRTGMSEQMFLDFDSRETARQMIIRTVVANTQLPKIMVDTIYQARGSKRVVEIVSLRNDSIKDIAPATDDQLQAYYSAHENEFVAPEYRGITIAHLATDTMEKDIAITDDETRSAYQTRATEMIVPETRDLIQIVIQDEAKAKAISDAAQKSKNLSDAAKAHGLTPITMNKIDDKAILPDLYSTVFAMEAGQVSPPVKSSLGWHVVQVKKINEGGQQTYDQVKETLRKTLQEERAGDVVAKTVNQIDDSLAAGQSLEDMADTLKLHLSRYPALDAKGQSADGKPVTDMPAKEITLPAAFALTTAGETGQVIDDGKGNYYVVRADQITPSQTRPFADAKKSVTSAWLEEQLYEKAKVAADEIAKALREGKTATSFASRPGIEVKLSKAISLLGDTDKEIPEAAIPEILAMKKGDVTTAAAKGKQYVLRLADVVSVDPTKPEGSRLKVVEDLKEKIPHNLIDQYAEHLRTLFPPSINKDLLNSLKNRSNDDAQ